MDEQQKAWIAKHGVTLCPPSPQVDLIWGDRAANKGPGTRRGDPKRTCMTEQDIIRCWCSSDYQPDRNLAERNQRMKRRKNGEG
jgi:hypothetical protein